MKKTAFALLLAASLSTANAQQDAGSLKESARASMQKGDFDNALLLLNKAKELQPADADLTKELAYVNYLRRDYAKTIELSKTLADKNQADEQAYQVWGMAYKAIAEYDEGDHMYKRALKVYPNSGVLYSEHGDLLSLKKETGEAIRQWEKGIEVAPSYSGNYYHAAKYYQENGTPLWSWLYGETFINLESLSGRTVEIKTVLLSDFRQLLSPGALTNAAKGSNAFAKAVAETLGKSAGGSAEVTAASLTTLREKFISEWFAGNATKFPFRLFDHQKQLVSQKMFESYNQWIFGAAINTTDFKEWITAHEAEIKAFQDYERNALFKVPAGQYYNK